MSNTNHATSIIKVDFQYGHRFMNYPGEAQFWHGHSGLLEVEVSGKVEEKTGFVYPIKDAKKIIWEVANNFHHGTLFQEGDPLLDLVLASYEKMGIRNGTPNTVAPKKLDHPLVWSYPECRVSVTKKVTSCENFCEIFYELLKDKLNIKKVTFRSSSLNAASRTYE